MFCSVSKIVLSGIFKCYDIVHAIDNFNSEKKSDIQHFWMTDMAKILSFLLIILIYSIIVYNTIECIGSSYVSNTKNSK